MLIIDMQIALVPALWRGEELASRIALVAQRARDRGVPVIAIQQTGPEGTPFDPEDPGWQLSPQLCLHDDDLRLRKSATDSFFRTNLAELLAAGEVDTVVISGAATDYCVDATARSALSYGFDVTLLGDGHAPVTEGDTGLSPEQIIRHHNWILSQAIHPGGTLRVVTAETAFTDAAP